METSVANLREQQQSSTIVVHDPPPSARGDCSIRMCTYQLVFVVFWLENISWYCQQIVISPFWTTQCTCMVPISIVAKLMFSLRLLLAVGKITNFNDRLAHHHICARLRISINRKTGVYFLKPKTWMKNQDGHRMCCWCWVVRTVDAKTTRPAVFFCISLWFYQKRKCTLL